MGKLFKIRSLTVESGVEVNISNNPSDPIQIRILQGRLVNSGQGTVFFKSIDNNDETSQWAGIFFDRSEQLAFDHFDISNAIRGLTVSDSPNLEITNCNLFHNDTGVSLVAPSGDRYIKNKIAESLIYENGSGVSAVGTGAIIENSKIFLNSTGVNLSGGSCGGGAACGWSTDIEHCLIVGNGTGVNWYGHHVSFLSNDIVYNDVGINSQPFRNNRVDIAGNNLNDNQNFAVVNNSSQGFTLHNNWFGTNDNAQIAYKIYDIYDNFSLGMIILESNAEELIVVNHSYSLDQDGDGVIDPDDAFPFDESRYRWPTFYPDADTDGYGNPNTSIEAKSQPSGYVTDNTDCDDSDSTIHPGATEIRGDGIDQDCNGNDLPYLITYYHDYDSDGYGDPSTAQGAESQPTGYVTDNTDCNDSDSSIHPGATEIRGDGIDQDCNGSDLSDIQKTTLVLRDTSSSVTITAGSDTKIYGTAGTNSITLENGAGATLINMPGNNTITIESDSSIFTVFRSGAYVTFEGTDSSTVLKIPATLESQTIVFNDQTFPGPPERQKTELRH